MKKLAIAIAMIGAFSLTACNLFRHKAKNGEENKSSKSAAEGVRIPGEAELAAIKPQHASVTMQTLKDGYTIYTGVCTNCHGAKSIYMRPTNSWPGIIDEMAEKAKINSEQKNAVLMYVLSIKATQKQG